MTPNEKMALKGIGSFLLLMALKWYTIISVTRALRKL